MGKIITTLITVVIAVSASAAVWVGANLVFNQVRYKWKLFSTIAFGVVGFLVGVLLAGNRAIIGSVADEGDNFLLEFAQWVWFPLVLAAGAAVIGMLLSAADDQRTRLLVGAGGMGALGVISGLLIRSEVRPDIEPLALIGFTVVVGAIGGGISMLRSNPPVNGALLGAALGWILGAWAAPDLGDGPAVWPAIALAVPAALVGVRIALGKNPTLVQRGVIDQKSRGFIFLGPALLFIFIALVIPAIRTGYLSLLDRDGEEWAGLQNYIDTFQDKNSWNADGFTNMFGSWLFYIGLALLAIGGFIGSRSKKLTGRFVELGSPSSFPLLGAFVFLCFALFTALRGTLVNNLWWVVVVVIFSTGLGLAVAVLADNVKGERVAKSIIFMPMAISLVGATIIWRFMYLPRDTSVDQTGLMNAAWVGLGRLSTGSGIPTYIVGALSVLALLGLLVVVARSLTRRNYGRAAFPGVVAILLGWFTIRYFSDGGVGGVVPNDDGTFSPQTINFIQESPFNNVWLMVVFIWIQTGFAMVILSAAIKAVPEELIEAARVDGATASQVFWRVTLPQISSTIVVIVTTLIVGVMKVFDIVKVMTNGQFDTQVLANDMYNQSFSFFNIGRGAALAMLIFISVLPVMIYNIRQLQKEG